MTANTGYLDIEEQFLWSSSLEQHPYSQSWGLGKASNIDPEPST